LNYSPGLTAGQYIIFKTMKRKIYIDGLHWDNILALPCVRGLNKRGDNDIVVKVKVAKVSYIYAAVGDPLKVKVAKVSYIYAAAGDAIVEKDDGSWSVERKENMAPRRLQSGYMLCPYYHKIIDISSCLPVERCVDMEKRELRKCEWTPEKGCFKYPKGGQQ
jgi:hypothetical protein